MIASVDWGQPGLGWESVRFPGGECHVVPMGDYRPHAEHAACWCRPTDDDGVVVHHALDNREAYENGKLRIA